MSKNNLPSQYGDEAKKYRELLELGSNRTISGNINYTSATSSILYSSTTGEEGLFIEIGNALAGYLIDEDWIYNYLKIKVVDVEPIENNAGQIIFVEV